MAFAGEAENNKWFLGKTLIFDPKSRKYKTNFKKYVKIQGFLGTLVETPEETPVEIPVETSFVASIVFGHS